MARLISVRKKNGTLWNLPTVKGDWYVYALYPGELRTGRLTDFPDGQNLLSKEHCDLVTDIKAWCRLDGDMNKELVQPEDYVIVNEYLAEV